MAELKQTRWSPFADEKQLGLVSSFDDPAATMRYMITAQSIDALIENPQPIEHVIAQEIELVDEETGEINRAVRTTLVTPDGKAFAAVSEGVLNSIQQLQSANMYGAPPWAPPVMLELVKVKTRKGFFTSRLVPVVKAKSGK